MIATEEKENKVKYAWKKPTIGNLTAGLTESVSCLLPFVSQELGICSERSQQALRLSKKFHWSLPQVWPLSLSDVCPLSRAETADLYNRGEGDSCAILYSFHRKVQLRGSFKRMNEYTTRTHGIAIPQHFGPFSPLTEIWSGVSKPQ